MTSILNKTRLKSNNNYVNSVLEKTTDALRCSSDFTISEYCNGRTYNGLTPNDYWNVNFVFYVFYCNRFSRTADVTRTNRLRIFSVCAQFSVTYYCRDTNDSITLCYRENPRAARIRAVPRCFRLEWAKTIRPTVMLGEVRYGGGSHVHVAGYLRAADMGGPSEPASSCSFVVGPVVFVADQSLLVGITALWYKPPSLPPLPQNPPTN